MMEKGTCHLIKDVNEETVYIFSYNKEYQITQYDVMYDNDEEHTYDITDENNEVIFEVIEENDSYVSNVTLLNSGGRSAKSSSSLDYIGG